MPKIQKYKVPIMRAIPNVLKFGPQLSENVFWDIHGKCMENAKKNLKQKFMIQDLAIPWIHLADGVSRGTISQLEAYDAIGIGYLPENLKVRVSYYNHLL